MYVSARSGFLGTFDFLYLPIDPETNAPETPARVEGFTISIFRV